MQLQLLCRHGTRCAGEVAMIANNQKCGVGVAYDALIGGNGLVSTVASKDSVASQPDVHVADYSRKEEQAPGIL